MDYGVPPWLLLLAGAAVTYTFLRRWTTLDLFKIPTPWGLPWVGQLIQLCQYVYNPHQQFLKWHEQLGPIVRLRIFHRDVVLVADPQVASQLLSKGPNECYRRAPEYVTYDAVGAAAGGWGWFRGRVTAVRREKLGSQLFEHILFVQTVMFKHMFSCMRWGSAVACQGPKQLSAAAAHQNMWQMACLSVSVDPVLAVQLVLQLCFLHSPKPACQAYSQGTVPCFPCGDACACGVLNT